jgi:hypothetical protein
MACKHKMPWETASLFFLVFFFPLYHVALQPPDGDVRDWLSEPLGVVEG